MGSGNRAGSRDIRKYLRDVLKVIISRGYLRKLIAKVTKSLDHAYEELLSLLPGEDVVNVDETGHKEAKQAIRFVVIDRRITQGTRSEAGRRWCERIWTTLAICARTGRDVLDFLYQTLLAHWNGHPSPSLLEIVPP